MVPQFSRPDSMNAAAAAIQQQWSARPRIAIILGTGLGGLTSATQIEAAIPFRDLPGMPETTALAHRGVVVCGCVAATPVVMFAGRCHLYEGYTSNEVTRSVRLAAALGARILILSNASGAVNSAYQAGDVMLMTDHINLMGRAGVPTGLSTSSRGGCRPAHAVYDEQLRRQAARLAGTCCLCVHHGVYAGMTGPNYETRAEYRMLRRVGADVVGMSTIPEALCAAALGMRVLGVSVVTNVARPDVGQQVDAADVVAAATRTEPRLQEMIVHLVSELVF